MQVTIETILNEDSMKLTNSVISYTNSHRTLTRLVMALRAKIHNLKLHKEYNCGSGASHVWMSRISDGERILLITE